ncbi:hypothetical protein GG344DRAFT_83118 [Lentinula edodes]|nr:hypothetical protein GG344DRAFT_83118 [Lentinula edodes]
MSSLRHHRDIEIHRPPSALVSPGIAPTSPTHDGPFTPSVIQALNSANEQTWLLIGRVAEKMGDLDHALFACENALRLNPTSLLGLTKAATLRIKKNYSKVKISNAGPTVHIENSVQQLCGLYPDGLELSIQYLTESLEADSSDAQNWHLLGRAYMSHGNYNQAHEAYQKALDYDGENPTLWCSIGALYFQLEQFGDAIDAYSRALRIDPYISEIWFGLGSLYESRDNGMSDALCAYARASELDPGNIVISHKLRLLKTAQTAHATRGPLDTRLTTYASGVIIPLTGITGPSSPHIST